MIRPLDLGTSDAEGAWKYQSDRDGSAVRTLAVGLMCSAGAALAFYIPTAQPPATAPEAPCVAVGLPQVGQTPTVTGKPSAAPQGRLLVDFDGRTWRYLSDGLVIGYSRAEDSTIWTTEECV